MAYSLMPEVSFLTLFSAPIQCLEQSSNVFMKEGQGHFVIYTTDIVLAPLHFCELLEQWNAFILYGELQLF